MGLISITPEGKVKRRHTKSKAFSIEITRQHLTDIIEGNGYIPDVTILDVEVPRLDAVVHLEALMNELMMIEGTKILIIVSNQSECGFWYVEKSNPRGWIMKQEQYSFITVATDGKETLITSLPVTEISKLPSIENYQVRFQATKSTK
jgi:hypothetical protein